MVHKDIVTTWVKKIVPLGNNTKIIFKTKYKSVHAWTYFVRMIISVAFLYIFLKCRLQIVINLYSLRLFLKISIYILNPTNYSYTNKKDTMTYNRLVEGHSLAVKDDSPKHENITKSEIFHASIHHSLVCHSWITTETNLLCFQK